MDVKKSFQIFKRDVLRLLRNPVAMVITIGICIIPSLYAWYNIAASWDPYGSTAGVKIAVANEDEGTSNELVGELNAGEQTMDELKKNFEYRVTNAPVVISKKGDKEYTAQESVTVTGPWSEDRIYCPYPTTDGEKNPNLKH